MSEKQFYSNILNIDDSFLTLPKLLYKSQSVQHSLYGQDSFAIGHIFPW